MSPEQSFFIEILKDHLAGAETILKSNIDWNMISSYAKMHQLEGIVYFQCKRFIPAEINALLDQKLKVTLFYYKNRERDSMEMKAAFERAGIDCFTVKGMDIAACYPLPALRTMGDLDVIVHRDDKKRAGDILESLGYIKNGNLAPDYDWAYDRNNMHIELHHQLFYDEPGRTLKQVDFFNRCWEYVDHGRLNNSFHFLFVLAHLRKHMVNAGAGFRMFMDLATMINNSSGLDWKWIEETLKQLEMWKFSQICFALCERWYGVKAPIQFNEIEDAFAEEATQMIFANGVFGFNNEGNRNNVTINGILKHGKARQLSRAQMVINHLFPKYIHMRYIPYYSFIEGRPWLLPVAWIYRISRLLTGKIDSMPQFAKKVRVLDSEVDAREEEMRRWGLFDEA